MHIYEIVNGTSSRSIITDDPVEIEELRQKKWWVSEAPIIWSGDGAKRVNDKWELEDVPVIPPVDPPKPTPEEIKQQKLQQLDWDYQQQSVELARAWANASMDGNKDLADSIASDRGELKKEYEQKRGEING